jgi:dihydrofolate reductase
MTRTGGVSLIWAQSASGVIGRGGGIPWRLPEDQARFRELTLGHTVVMGRRTWESLPAAVRPLPGRRNVVVTRQDGFAADGARVVHDLDAALTDADTWVIGGEQIYTLAMPRAGRCEVTEVDAVLSCDGACDEDDIRAPVPYGTWAATTGEWQISSSGLRYRFHSYFRR